MKQVIKKIMPPPLKACIRGVLSQGGRVLQHIPRDARVFSAPAAQVFFGYYDVTPFGPGDRVLLAMHAPPGNISPHNDHPELKLGFYDLSLEFPVFEPFAATKTWNWQQGCRFQWLGNANRVIYNSIVDGRCGAVVHDIGTGAEVGSFNCPIYSVSSNGKWALSLDFSVLHKYRRGYGYSNFPAGNDSGDIVLLDLETGARKTVLTMEQARAFDPHPDMDQAQHYFNHLSFSPGATRFMVTHLWLTEEGKRYTRILIVGSKDGDILCPDNSGQTSHYAWLDDDRALIFRGRSGLAGQYILHDLVNGNQEALFSAVLNQDGHPSITENFLLTDTYPDLAGVQHLLLFSRKNGNWKALAGFYAPRSFSGELRCDLHPRLNRAADKICVDGIQNGRRAMFLLDLPELGN